MTFAAKKPGDQLRLYTITPENGVPEALPSDGHSQVTPDWMPDENSLIYGRLPGVDDASTIAFYRVDLRTHRSERIPGTDGLYNPLWSHDGQHLAALDSANERLVLIDVEIRSANCGFAARRVSGFGRLIRNIFTTERMIIRFSACVSPMVAEGESDG